MSLSLFEEMYYKLPESEREVFLNGLNKEDREKLLLNISKKIINENILDSQKEAFDNIYNYIEDVKIKNSFLNIFYILDNDKRYALLKILSSKYKCKNVDYGFNLHIKNILNRDDINYIKDNNFNRILYTLISNSTLDILRIIFNKDEIYFTFDEDKKCIHINEDDFSSIKNNIISIDKSELKSLYMLNNIPNEKRVYFFKIFENHKELNCCIDIKILRYIYNINEEAFLSFFNNEKKYYLEEEIKTNNFVFTDIYGEYDKDSLSNIINYLYDINFKGVAVGNFIAKGIVEVMFELIKGADFVKAFETKNIKLLKNYFIRILEIIIRFNTNYILNILENLYRYDKDSLILSQLISFYNIKEYLSILKK